MIYNYITTNIVNCKQYIGMHSTDDPDDGYLGSGRLLIKAIKKYGKDNFIREIICYCVDEKTAYINEGILIERYHTLYPKGYNLSPTGGLGPKGKHLDISKKKIGKYWKGRKRGPMSEETKRKASVAHSKHRHSEETKLKISQSGRLRKDRPWLGKHHTEESKIKMRKPKSEVTKEKMKISNKGKRKSSLIKSQLPKT